MVKLVFLILLALAAPTAVAADPFHEPVCVSTATCVGAGTCVSSAACLPRGCEPAADCSASAGDMSVCSVNVSIDGETCQTAVALDAHRDGHHVTDGVDVAGSGLVLAVTLTDGSVDGYNLQNVWITPAVEAGLVVAGMDAGYTAIGAYRSDIDTEGPRGGPYGLVAPGYEHTWTQLSVVATNSGGDAGPQDIQVSVWLLDYAPDGCHVRSPSGRGVDLACPRVQDLP